MKIRYLLKRRGKRESTYPIYVALYQGEQTELIYTKERIPLKEWSQTEGQPKDHTGDLFGRIERIRLSVQRSAKMLEAQERPVTPFTVKQEFVQSQFKRNNDQVTKDKNDKKDLETVSSLAKKWLENNLFGYKPSTQKTIKQSIGQFQLYLKSAGQNALTRAQLSPEFITAYERYLQDKKRLSNSTHGRTMKHLRWFLKTLNYDVRTIAIRSHRKDIVALTLEELESLEKVDVGYSKEFQKAKDMFLLGCYTGLRISDLKRLNATRLVDNKICMTLQKNKKPVSIPVRSETMAILKKYGIASPKISEQHLNRDIKKVCDKAGIKRLVTVKTNKAGLDVETEVPKHKLITSHTSSKTFITLAPKRFNMTPAEIAAVVGKDLKTLINHYFQLPLESAMLKMSEEGSVNLKIAN
jgi:integrase